MHGEAKVKTKREGHGSLAGRRLLGGVRWRHKRGEREMIVLQGEDISGISDPPAHRVEMSCAGSRRQIPPSLTKALRFEIHGVALAA